MITRVVPVDPVDPDPSAIAEAAAILRSGGLVAFATETVYGLGADATNPAAVARIFAAKGRPPTNPLIVHADGVAMARRCVSHWPAEAESLAGRYWPGPLTIVLPRSAIIPDVVTAGQDTVGVRVPRHRAALALIRMADRPIAAPSANRSTGVSPTLADHVLKDLDGHVDLILDSGYADIGIESTVLDLSGTPPRILRPGKITREELARFLFGPVEGIDGDFSPRSPGQMAIHYAPRKPVYRLDRDRFDDLRGRRPGRHRLIKIGEEPEVWRSRWSGVSRFIHLEEPEIAALRLYECLHEFEDDPRLAFLAILPPPDEPEWRAIRDRLWRATTPWPADAD